VGPGELPALPAVPSLPGKPSLKAACFSKGDSLDISERGGGKNDCKLTCHILFKEKNSSYCLMCCFFFFYMAKITVDLTDGVLKAI